MSTLATKCASDVTTELTSQSALTDVTVLVVDDNPVDRRLGGGLISKHLGCKVLYASNGRQALRVMEGKVPNVVLTDMLMPEMDGLELVEAIRCRYPLVPVILMTAFGSEELAIKALHNGAASYVPKKSLGKAMADTVETVLAAARANHHHHQLEECLTCIEAQYVLDNDPSVAHALVAQLQDSLSRLRLCDHTGRIRVAIALEEALSNSIYHGNLELDPELRQNDSEAYLRLAAERRQSPPYSDRHLYLTARTTRTEAVYRIRDEGPGYDPSTLPDPEDPVYLSKLTGRGLLLIRNFMDEVQHNETGNEITMIKRRDRSRS